MRATAASTNRDLSRDLQQACQGVEEAKMQSSIGLAIQDVEKAARGDVSAFI